MCWGVEIYDKDKFVAEISTIKEAVDYFGIECIQIRPGYDMKVDPNDGCCLCPVDFDFLFEKAGYIRIAETDPRFSWMDVAVEKING
jgi:hypothetical protein